MIRFEVPPRYEGLSALDCLYDFFQEQLSKEELKREFFGDKSPKAGLKTLAPEDLPKAGKVLSLNTKYSYEHYMKKAAVEHEDESFFICNKPYGLATTELSETEPSLYALARQYMKEKGEFNLDALTVPYICNVLEKDMGGLVIVAKTQDGFEYMLQALKERRVARFYLAKVSGDPKSEDELFGYMKDEDFFPEQVRGSRKVSLRYRLVGREEEFSLLEIQNITNLKGQIQALLAHAGLSVLGDARTGDKKLNKKYASNHISVWAHRIAFHTGTNNWLDYLNGKEVKASRLYLN